MGHAQHIDRDHRQLKNERPPTRVVDGPPTEKNMNENAETQTEEMLRRQMEDEESIEKPEPYFA
jgi:hypothetical protein